MHLASYVVRGRSSFGVVQGDGIVDLRMRLGARYGSVLDLLVAGALNEAAATVAGVRPDFALAEAEFVTPVPGGEKVLCIGVNYANRNAELSGGVENAKYPSMFFRTPNSLVGHGRKILRPPESEQLDYEGEIAIVIGKTGRRIPKEQALSHIAGVALCNEGTIRDWLRHGRFNVTQGKNFDGTGSLGPWLTTGLDLAKPLHLTVSINGAVTQDDTTASMIFSFADLIAYVSTFMTLKPGDIIATGTPTKAGAGAGNAPEWLKPGDTISLSVPEIGTLTNVVADEKESA